MERIKKVEKVDGGSFEIFGGKKYTTVDKIRRRRLRRRKGEGDFARIVEHVNKS